MHVNFNESMSCSVFQRNKDVSPTRGKHLDLKLHPEQAVELPEAKEWPALGAFIEAVNRCPVFFTSGCMATGVTPGGHEAPYVDVAFYEQPMRLSPTACRLLANRFFELGNLGGLSEFTLDLCGSTATFPDGEEVSSLRCWFLGSRSDAERAFPSIIEKLQEQNAADYIPIAENDYGKAMQRLAEQKLRDREFKRFLVKSGLSWLAFACAGTWLLSGYGWLGCIGGFLAGTLAFPITVIFGLLLAGWWYRRTRRGT